LSEQDYVYVSLYLVTILLATYGLWESFPRGFPAGRKLALSGALLALFLTFFLTSLGVDQTQDDIHSLQKSVHVLRDALDVDEQIETLLHSPGSESPVLLQMLLDASDRCADLARRNEAIFSECEGYQFIASMIRAELLADSGGLRIVATSIDAREFEEPRSSLECDYDEALFGVVDKCGPGSVERTYVLPDTLWALIQAFRDSLSRAYSPVYLPEAHDVARLLSRLGLHAIHSHYIKKVRCNLAPESLLAAANRHDYDLIVVSRNAEILFGANRESGKRMRVVLGEARASTWRTKFNDLRNNRYTFRLPLWNPAEAQR